MVTSFIKIADNKKPQLSGFCSFFIKADVLGRGPFKILFDDYSTSKLSYKHILSQVNHHFRKNMLFFDNQCVCENKQDFKPIILLKINNLV